jgi:hypothetical protein
MIQAKYPTFSKIQLGLIDLGAIIPIIFIGALFWWIVVDNEREGTARYGDCREIVRLQSDTFQKYYKNFTCNGQKTRSGIVMNGECVHIDYTGWPFSSSGECKVAYVYTRRPGASCNNPELPYLWYDDKCHATPL